MIKIEKTEITGWEAAVRGMRNPKNSWDRTDSGYYEAIVSGTSMGDNNYIVGDNDYKLMTTLRNAGTDHRKFMRMITVYADITAPLYWWKEYDTYKVGTVANSCSTMHKIMAKDFTLDDFSHEHLGLLQTEEDGEWINSEAPLNHVIAAMNEFRHAYLRTKDKPMKEEAKRAVLMKKYWWQLIQLLPSSYNQKRTVMLNYEVLANQYKSRKDHKLDEWHYYCRWIEGLPYSELITGGDVK